MDSLSGRRPVEIAALAAQRPYARLVVSFGGPWLVRAYPTHGTLRFSGQAWRLLGRADQAASRLGHDYLGTEHLLLGLLHDPGGNAAARTLELLGFELEPLRQQVEEIAGDNWTRRATFGPIPVTPRAATTLRLARREALRLGHGYIGSEHILLGLIAEREGVAAQVLIRAGAAYRPVRDLLRSDPGSVGSPQDGSLVGILGARLASIDAQLSALRGPAEISRPEPAPRADPDRPA